MLIHCSCYETLRDNLMLDVEPTYPRVHMTTESYRDGLDLEKFVVENEDR